VSGAGVTNGHLVIDAINLIGSRPTGWWRDRDGAVRKLAARLQRLSAADSRTITLVVDGSAIPNLPEGMNGGVKVLYASRRGPNAADDRIVEFIAGQTDPASVEVVTSDRELSRRVRSLGASVSGPTAVLNRLDALDAQNLAAGRRNAESGRQLGRRPPRQLD
jgi:predicted RNA-binding protein with PIN domain